MSNTTENLTSIETTDLNDITGGKGFLQTLGKTWQSLGEGVAAVGTVGSAVPVLGETGIPEGVAAGGAATWLIGKGTEALGKKLHK